MDAMTKDAYKSASYTSSVGSSGYNSSGTNINTNSAYSNNFYAHSSGDVNVKNSVYNSYDLPNTDKLRSPLRHDEALAQEVLAKAGPANTYQRMDHSHDIGSLANADGVTSTTSSFQDYSNINQVIRINTKIVA